MSRRRAIAVALLVSVAALGVAPGALADGTVDAEDGGTYEIPVTLQFDVDGGSDDYTVRTAEGMLVVQLVPEDGTVTLDTAHMDPGDYVLKSSDTGETLYEFSLVGDPSTPAETTPSTEPATESEASAVRAELRVPAPDRPDAVDATDRQVVWAGQDVAFRVDGDTSYRLFHDGERLGRLTGADHYRYLNTTALEPGMYTVQRRGGHDVYRFSLAEQTISATITESELVVASNRGRFDIVLSSPNVSTAQLLNTVPSATREDGRVVVSDVGSDTSIPVEAGALPVGTHTLRLTVADTGATANATLQVTARNDSATASTATAQQAISTATTTTTVTESATSTTTDTATTPSASASTSVDAPGFGVIPVVGLLSAITGLSLFRRR